MSKRAIEKEGENTVKVFEIDPQMKSITEDSVSPASSKINSSSSPVIDSPPPPQTPVVVAKEVEAVKMVKSTSSDKKADKSALKEVAKEIVIDAKTEKQAIEKVTHKSKPEYVTMKMAYAPNSKTSKWEPSKCYGVAFERLPGEVQVSAFECPTKNQKCPLKPSHDKCTFMPLKTVKADIAL